MEALKNFIGQDCSQCGWAIKKEDETILFGIAPLRYVDYKIFHLYCFAESGVDVQILKKLHIMNSSERFCCFCNRVFNGGRRDYCIMKYWNANNVSNIFSIFESGLKVSCISCFSEQNKSLIEELQLLVS